MTKDNINKYKKLVSYALNCPIDKIEVYIFSYAESGIEETYSEYSDDKYDQIKSFLNDSQDLRNTATFEPFIHYFEETDEFIEIGQDLLSKYLNFNNISDIINFTGRYIAKDKILDTPQYSII